LHVAKVWISVILYITRKIQNDHSKAGSIAILLCIREKMDFTFEICGQLGFCNHASVSMLDCELLSYYCISSQAFL
jgi:hypothetical protein